MFRALPLQFPAQLPRDLSSRVIHDCLSLQCVGVTNDGAYCVVTGRRCLRTSSLKDIHFRMDEWGYLR